MNKEIDFGDYVEIEQKRYGCDNEMFMYKVVGALSSNTYRGVPVDARQRDNIKGDMKPIINAIRCGISEDTVERFRVEDVKLLKHIGRRTNKDFNPNPT